MGLSFLFLCLLILSLFSFIVQAVVPPSARFKKYNSGDFGEYYTEYNADHRALDIYGDVFQLCFYNTTPDAFTLAIRMGTRRSNSWRRFVWEANRGNPVRDNSTLTFGEDGNLVLADADGRIAWQTNTANKGVVGLELLPTGNLVLRDAKGNFVWQSYDSPTDTLLVGQSLRVGGVTRLVSRASDKQNLNGAYSLVMEPKRLALYYKSPNSPKSYVYYSSDLLSVSKGRLQYVKLNSTVDPDDNLASEMVLDFSTGGSTVFSRVNYDSRLSFLRLGVDGNLRIYTFNDRVHQDAWRVTYTLFSREPTRGIWESKCQLPERCGKFGLCEDSQCVGCPLPNGFRAWSKDCAPVMSSVCDSEYYYYYKLQGVDHSMTKYSAGSGPMKEGDCEKKCSSECKCSGYFYNTQTSRCWTAYDLQTLTRVGNSTHNGYIKVPNHHSK